MSKAAQYRRAWPARDGAVHDGIGCALPREDRERGTTTPVDWDGERRTGPGCRRLGGWRGC